MRWSHTPFFHSHPHWKAFGKLGSSLPPSQPRRLLPLLLSIDFKLLLPWGSALPDQSWGYEWTWHHQPRCILPWLYQRQKASINLDSKFKVSREKGWLHSMVKVPSWLTQGWKVVQGQIVSNITIGADISGFGIPIIIREQSWLVPKFYLSWNDKHQRMSERSVVSSALDGGWRLRWRQGRSREGGRLVHIIQKYLALYAASSSLSVFGNYSYDRND